MAKLFRIICGIEGMRSVSVEGETENEVRKKIKKTILYHEKRNWRLEKDRPCSPGLYCSSQGWRQSESIDQPEVKKVAIDNYVSVLSFVKERE